MQKIISLVAGWLAVVMLAVLPQPSQALTIDSLDCSVIDATDGNTYDWKNIPYLIDTDESVDGTTYYLQADGSWTATEPADWRYSMNLEKQANIQEMKVCNTDTFFLLLNTEEPMMSAYDKEQDGYVDLWSPYDTTDEQNPSYFTLPDDFHYWMVWKMQAADGTGSIMYFAANLEMDAGSVQDVQVPLLYLFEESDAAATFETAAFDATEDTELTTIEISRDGEDPCDVAPEESPEGCSQDVIDKDDSAFEVSQDIFDLFTYADFSFGDAINITATMYNSDTFGVASDDHHMSLSAVDTTATAEYTFSQRPVRDLHPVKNSLGSSKITLKWKPLAGANSYQLKLINPSDDSVVRMVKNIRSARYVLRDLDTNTEYRAIVRAVLRKSGEKSLSAWSSGYNWTTTEE